MGTFNKRWSLKIIYAPFYKIIWIYSSNMFYFNLRKCTDPNYFEQ